MLAEPAIAVRCRNVIKTYGAGETSVQALRGIDLELHAGELHWLVDRAAASLLPCEALERTRAL